MYIYVCIYVTYCEYIYIYPHQRTCLLILERDKGRKRERNINQLPPICTLIRNQTCNLGMCPDWGSSMQPFGPWDDAPTN